MQIKRIAMSLPVLLMSGCLTPSKLLTSALNPVSQVHSTYTEGALMNPKGILGDRILAYDFARGEGSQDSELERWAPMIVQGILSENSDRYSPDEDHIGMPHLVPSEQQTFNVKVDVSRPVLFGEIQTARIHGKEFKQLVYVFWYPRCASGLIEKGPVDGGILRLTLDESGHPFIGEYVKPCGCYHTSFVSTATEMNSLKTYGQPQRKKMFAVERSVPHSTDWKVRRIIPGMEDSRLVLFMGRGKHLLEGVTVERRLSLAGTDRSKYELLPYRDLERLAIKGGGTGSMFNSSGLVWGAMRKYEEKIFAHVDHPGWPRRLENIQIHFDESRFSDPELLDRHLRLPMQRIPVRARQVAERRTPSQKP